MTIAAISLVSTSGLSIYTQINAYRYELDNRANLLSKMTANAVASPLRNSSQALVEESLQFLDAADKVLNVHIYKTLPDDSNTLSAVERFASYNKGGQLLIPRNK